MPQSFAEALSWVPKSPGLAATLACACDFARSQAHRTVTLEHLLLALISDGDASPVLQACNVNLARLNADATHFLVGLDDRAPPGSVLEPAADPDLIRILEYAAAAARQSRRREANGAIVLAAIVGDGRSAAANMLGAQGLTFEAAIKELQRANGAGQSPMPSSTAPAQTAAEMASPVWPDPSPLGQQPVAVAPVPPAPSLHSWPGESSQANSVSEVAPHSVNGTRTTSTEEILATARRRVEADRKKSAAGALAPQPPGQGAPELYPESHVDSGPHPTRPLSSLSGPRTDIAGEPDPQATSRNSAQQMAGTSAAGSGVAPALSPEASDADALSAAPASDRAPEAKLASGPTAPPPPSGQILTDPLAVPPPSELLPQSPQPILALASSGASPGLPSRWQDVVARGARVPPPLPSAPPQYGELPASHPVLAPWPEPFTTGEPGHNRRRDLAFEGNISGPPLPALEEAAPSRLPMAAAKVPAPAGAPHRPAAHVPAAQLVENIPRKLTVGLPLTVEARIAKASVRALAEGLQGAGAAYRHDVIITKAMSVRLRAPDGGFWIETASPETQWIEDTHGLLTDDFASWRWTVMPQHRGRARLHLVVSARTVGADGLAAETALPDQVVEVRVRTNYRRTAARWGGWIAAAMLGGVLARVGEGIWDAGLVAYQWIPGL